MPLLSKLHEEDKGKRGIQPLTTSSRGAKKTARIEDPLGWTTAEPLSEKAEADLRARASRDELPKGVSVLLWGWLPWDNMDINLEVLRCGPKHLPWLVKVIEECERQYAEEPVKKKRGANS